MSNADFSRFDIPSPVRNILGIAADHGVLDGAECFTLGVLFGASDWGAVVDYCCEAAFADRSGDGGAVHASIVAAAEGYWASTQAGG